jgi:hypothetical protein
MIIELKNRYFIEIKKDVKKFKTIQITKAFLPISYYNIKGSLNNNYIRYVILDNDKKMGDRGSLIIPDGLYTPETYNDALQVKGN